MKALSISALVSAILAITTPAAMASEITLDAPLKGATLHSGDVGMSLYFAETAGNGFKVVATYVSATASDLPARIMMELSDGDSVKVGLPGHPGKLYEFSRNGRILVVSDEMVGGEGW